MTQAFNLSQFANKVDSSGQADLTTAVTGTLPIGNGGTGLTSVGTNGQLIYSNGSAMYWGNAPTSGVTSLNGQTGAITNTSLYAIGSYVLGRPANTTQYDVNATISGSSLYSVSGPIYWSSTGNWSGPVSTNITATLVNTGTWRCMSIADSVGATTLYGLTGLWVRIS